MNTYTKEQLLSFGNFLLKTYGVTVDPSDVSDNNLPEWEIEQDQKKIVLPSEIQIGDPCWLMLWEQPLVSECNGVHFYSGKIKYDLKVLAGNGNPTRLYNIDSDFVKRTMDS